MTDTRLLDKAKTLPKLPGCYLMKNKLGEIIYVGKAKDLKARVTSYFNNSAKTPKTEILVTRITEFEFIITKSDAESYVLENNLIKEHAPKYNIRLKDDKSYPYVIVDKKNDFARLQYVRRPKRDKNKIMFGPYPHGYGISQVLRALNKAFTLRDCSDYEMKSRKTPCLLYQIHQCSAPCVDKISYKDYQLDLNYAIDFLNGGKKAQKSIKHLKSKMMSYAEGEEFEKAAVIRDQLEVLEEFLEKNNSQSVENLDEQFMDVIAYYDGSEDIDISIYMIRSGNLLGHKNFHFPASELINDIEEEVMSFLMQYYSTTQEELPRHVICDFASENKKDFNEALNGILSTKVKVPIKTGKYQSLLDSTKQHAEENQRVRLLNQNSVYVGLNKLKDLLNLKERPRTIECYDVAIWQGKSPTASQVSFHDGKPDKKKYRYYHMKERPEGNNDFAMMEELFCRRLDNGHLPDLFVVDGGKGQLNVVVKVLEEVGIDIPVVSIAKAKSGKGNSFRDSHILKTEERLFIPGRSNPVILNKSPALFRLIVSMRDEAHRFSRVLHHKAEKKRFFKSWLDDVNGIGERVKQKILTRMNFPFNHLKEMSQVEIKEKFDLTEQQARSIKEYLESINSERE
jgi:excinuclease ABC subunit C